MHLTVKTFSLFFNLRVSSQNRGCHYKKWLTGKVLFPVYWVQSFLFINPTGLMLQQQSVSVFSTSRTSGMFSPRCFKDATLCPDAQFFKNSLDLGQRTCKNVTFWCEATLSQFTHLLFSSGIWSKNGLLWFFRKWRDWWVSVYKGIVHTVQSFDLMKNFSSNLWH